MERVGWMGPGRLPEVLTDGGQDRRATYLESGVL
jgi:hypothetical protein